MFLALTFFMYHQDTESCEAMLYLHKRGVFAPLFFFLKNGSQSVTFENYPYICSALGCTY